MQNTVPVSPVIVFMLLSPVGPLRDTYCIDCCSEGGARLGKKVPLLRGRFPTKDSVTVRIASETPDDIPVPPFIIQAALHARHIEQHHGPVMHCQRLAVHEGHVEKTALHHWQRLIHTQRDRLLRQHQGHAILVVGGGMGAEQMAQELIQHYDLRQSASGAGAPVPPRAGSRLPVPLAEALTNQLRQRSVTLARVGWLEFIEPGCQYCL